MPRSLLLATALASAACSHATTTERPPATADVTSFLRVEPVTLDVDGADVVAPASITYDEERVAAVVAPVPGRVVRLLAAPGERVGAGAPLAVMYSADVAGAGAGLSTARVRRESAERTLARAEHLAADGAGSQRDVLDARSALASARAEEQRAATVVRVMGAAGSTAGAYTLRAPVAGTVVRRSLRIGHQARPDASEPAFLIADLGRVWVTAHLHEAQGEAVRAGDRAEVELRALPGRRFTGTVDRVADSVNPAAHTLVARVVLSNEDGALRPEMFARVTIRTASSGSVLVPRAALVTDGGGYATFVEGQGGRYERRRVVLGALLGGHARVREGLAAGERVVVDGALLLDAAAEQVL